MLRVRAKGSDTVTLKHFRLRSDHLALLRNIAATLPMLELLAIGPYGTPCVVIAGDLCLEAKEIRLLNPAT